MIRNTLLTVRAAKQCYCDTILLMTNEADNRPDYSRLLF